MVPAVANQFMKILRSREIVIEFERVQLITKKAKTRVVLCTECGSETDFVSLRDAAELFDTEIDLLTSFIAANGCHFRTDSVGSPFVCIHSLLDAMRRQSLGNPNSVGPELNGLTN